MFFHVWIHRLYGTKLENNATSRSSLQIARFPAKLKFPSWTECGNSVAKGHPRVKIIITNPVIISSILLKNVQILQLWGVECKGCSLKTVKNYCHTRSNLGISAMLENLQVCKLDHEVAIKCTRNRPPDHPPTRPPTRRQHNFALRDVARRRTT